MHWLFEANFTLDILVQEHMIVDDMDERAMSLRLCGRHSVESQRLPLSLTYSVVLTSLQVQLSISDFNT